MSCPVARVVWVVTVRGTLLALGGLGELVGITAWVALLAGAGTWLFGKPGSVHIGASGVIFGYLGVLLSRGIFDRQIRWIATSLLVGILYSGYLFVLFRVEAGVSWTGHFFGFASGVLAAWLIKDRRPAPSL